MPADGHQGYMDSHTVLRRRMMMLFACEPVFLSHTMTLIPSCFNTINWTNLLVSKGRLPEDISGLFLAREVNDSKGVVAATSQTEIPGHILGLLNPGQFTFSSQEQQRQEAAEVLAAIPGDWLTC